MVGFLFGLGLLFSYFASAWSGEQSTDSLLANGLLPALLGFAIFGLMGILFFPRTVGVAFTPMSFATPVAFLVALFRHGFGYAMAIAALGIAAWAVTFVVGSLRPEAT